MDNFPYTIREEYAKLDDGKCCAMVSEQGWHFTRCQKAAKKAIDGVGLCGIHARSVEHWRKQIATKEC